VGTIAQKWQEILPQVVRTASDRDRTLSMDYQAAALVSAIVTARRVCDHEARIRTLERENARLKKEIETLKTA
jgi:cell division protein FtsB